MILGDLQFRNNGPEMVLFTWRKNPLEKCFFFSECEMMTKDSLRLKKRLFTTSKQVFQFVIFMLDSDLYATVAHPTTSFQLKSNFILHLATLLWDPPDYLQTYVTLVTCLKNGQKTKNNIRFLPYFPSCRLLHPCHSIKISFGRLIKTIIFCLISVFSGDRWAGGPSTLGTVLQSGCSLGPQKVVKSGFVGSCCKLADKFLKEDIYQCWVVSWDEVHELGMKQFTFGIFADKVSCQILT